MRVPEDENNTEVPPEAIKQIQQFKNSLYDSLKKYFACQPSKMPEAQLQQSDLYGRLGITVPLSSDKRTPSDVDGPGSRTGLYLVEVTIKAQIVGDTRRLVAILTSFPIPYGEDAELDVFALTDKGNWESTIHFTSKPYNSIAGAFQGFDYKISPSDSKGNWFVVATHVNPWPTSCWQGLFVDAVRPQDLGMEYQFFHDQQYGYMCDDVAPYLRSVSVDGFQIRFSISSIDEGELISASVMTYKIEDGEVIRVQPVALNPVNFVDEWVRRTWQEAQGWSAQTNVASLQGQHSILHKQTEEDFAAFGVARSRALARSSWLTLSGAG